MTEVEPSMARTAVRPFRINVPREELVDFRRRILAPRWPDKETVADWSQGVPLATMQELARYWATEYDWRKCEAKPGVSGARIYWENKFRAISTPRMSPSRRPSASSPASNIKPRGVGPSGPITSSSITTSSTRAATSRPGNSRNFFLRRSVPRSDRCAHRGQQP
jgi:Epoxide hydrolase N terminus